MTYRNTLQQANAKNMPPRGSFNTTTNTRSRNSSMSSNLSAGEFETNNAPGMDYYWLFDEFYTIRLLSFLFIEQIGLESAVASFEVV